MRFIVLKFILKFGCDSYSLEDALTIHFTLLARKKKNYNTKDT